MLRQGISTPNSFVTLWTLKRCRWLHRVKDRGPLVVIFGGPHTSLPAIDKVRPGDTIYPVVVARGGLYLVAGMMVQEIMEADTFVRDQLGIDRPPSILWDQLFDDLKTSRPSVGHRVPTTCADLAAVGRDGSEIRFDRRVAPESLESLSLGPRPGREQRLKGISGGQLKNNFSFQGHLRRLSDASALIFSELLDGPYSSPSAF